MIEAIFHLDRSTSDFDTALYARTEVHADPHGDGTITN